MRLSPLQSRLVASLAASLLIIALYWVLFSPNFAVAAELPFRSDFDLALDVDGVPLEHFDELQPSYEPEFGLFDRSIIGRAPSVQKPLELNKAEVWNLEAGSSACYVLDKTAIFGDGGSQKRDPEFDGLEDDGDGNRSEGERMRRATKTLYVSANTCLQPSQTDPDSKNRIPPQLQLMASLSQDVGCPTTTDGLDENMWSNFDEGAGQLEFDVTDGPAYISLVAPKAPKGFEGVYNFELTVSTTELYHRYDSNTNSSSALLWMDSDSSAALLVTSNLTVDAADSDKIMQMDPPFELYVENAKYPVFDGIRRSACGLEKQALISATKNGDGRLHDLVRSAMTTRGAGGLPKQQFYFEGLNGSSNYNAILVQVSNDATLNIGKRQEGGSTSGNGTTIFDPIEFQTLTGKS